MGGIARLVNFTRQVLRGVQVALGESDPGGGALLKSEHFDGSGSDAHPLPDDFLILVPTGRTGGKAIVGYADTINEGKTGPGERRIYARDSEGAPTCEVWVKADGTIWLSNEAGTFQVQPSGAIKGHNENGSFELQDDGVFAVNGATIDTDGTITSPVAVVSPSVVADGKELVDHTHNITSGSSSPGPTAGNN